MKFIIQNQDIYGLLDCVTVSYPMSKIINFINRVLYYYQKHYYLENKLSYTSLSKHPYFDNYNINALSIIINVIVDEYYDIVMLKGFKFTDIIMFPKSIILLRGYGDLS